MHPITQYCPFHSIWQYDPDPINTSFLVDCVRSAWWPFLLSIRSHNAETISSCCALLTQGMMEEENNEEGPPTRTKRHILELGRWRMLEKSLPQPPRKPENCPKWWSKGWKDLVSGIYLFLLIGLKDKLLLVCGLVFDAVSRTKTSSRLPFNPDARRIQLNRHPASAFGR